MKGYLVAIEGADGAGTTTQGLDICVRLERAFEKEGKGRHAIYTREPFNNELGGYIRRLLSVMSSGTKYPQSLYDELALDFAANRLQHYNNFIAPYLESGAVVVSDRYKLSSLVYQGLTSDYEWVAQVNSRAREADLLIYLRCGDGVCGERLKRRGLPEEYYEGEGLRVEVLKRYDEEYKKYEGMKAEVDGEMEIERVTEFCYQRVLELVGVKG